MPFSCRRRPALLRFSRWLGRCALGAALTFAGPARAQEVDEAALGTARQLAAEGSAFFERGNYEQAYDRFRRAYALAQTPSVGLEAARSLVALGRYVEAAERLREIQRRSLPETAPPEQAKAREDARAELAALVPRIPSVRVVVEGAAPEDVFVTINGELLPATLIGVGRPVDPGSVAVKGTRGADTVQESVEVVEGELRDVTLRFNPVAAPPVAPPPAAPVYVAPEPLPSADPGRGQRTIGYVTIGVGSAGVVIGSIFGVLGLTQKSDLDAACPERSCPPSQYDALDTYEERKVIASVGLIGGALLVASGAALVLSAPAPGAPRQGGAPVLGNPLPRVSVRFGLGHAALFGELP